MTISPICTGHSNWLHQSDYVYWKRFSIIKLELFVFLWFLIYSALFYDLRMALNWHTRPETLGTCRWTRRWTCRWTASMSEQLIGSLRTPDIVRFQASSQKVLDTFSRTREIIVAARTSSNSNIFIIWISSAFITELYEPSSRALFCSRLMIPNLWSSYDLLYGKRDHQQVIVDVQRR